MAPPIQLVSWTLPMGQRGQGRETGHSSPSSAEVKNGGAIPPLPHVFIHVDVALQEV
jgi:hypothetical protein